MNLQADPTLAAVMQKKVKKRKEELKRKREENILSTYGEQNKYKAPDRSLLFGETEQEVRYTKDGRIKGSTWCSSAKRENFNHITSNTTSVTVSLAHITTHSRITIRITH